MLLLNVNKILLENIQLSRNNKSWSFSWYKFNGYWLLMYIKIGISKYFFLKKYYVNQQ